MSRVRSLLGAGPSTSSRSRSSRSARSSAAALASASAAVAFSLSCLWSSIALVEAISQATAIAEKGEAISDTGLELLPSHIGSFAHIACLEAATQGLAAGGRERTTSAVAASAATTLVRARDARVAQMMAGMVLDPVAAAAMRTQITQGLESSGWYKPAPTWRRSKRRATSRR